MTTDKIIIKGLRCTAHIGCKEDERALPQALLLDVVLLADTRSSAEADNLELTVNYARLSKELIRACEASTCQLIETLAANLAAMILNGNPIVEAVTLTVRKPAGLANGDYAAVEITRTRA
jgi:dihydroneopterin aldolase